MSQLTTAYWPADPSVPVLPATIGGILRATAERDGDRVALIGGDPDPERRPRWSYGELLAEAERAARALLTRFQPGERVAVWSANRPEWVLLEFATALAGLTLVPVNPAYQAEELGYVLSNSRARRCPRSTPGVPRRSSTPREPPAARKARCSPTAG